MWAAISPTVAITLIENWPDPRSMHVMAILQRATTLLFPAPSSWTLPCNSESPGESPCNPGAESDVSGSSTRKENRAPAHEIP